MAHAEGGSMTTRATTSDGTSYKSAPSPMLSVLFLAACVSFANLWLDWENSTMTSCCRRSFLRVHLFMSTRILSFQLPRCCSALNDLEFDVLNSPVRWIKDWLICSQLPWIIRSQFQLMNGRTGLTLMTYHYTLIFASKVADRFYIKMLHRITT